MACNESHFDRLSTELVLQIFEFLNDASPKSLLNVALVCREFHTHSNPIIHRCLVIPISTRAYRTVGELIKHLYKDTELCAAVREMVVPYRSKILGAPSASLQLKKSKAHEEQWDRLTNVLPLLHRLNKFTYEAEAPIPLALLDYLNNRRSGCRLHVNVTHLPQVKHLSRLRDLDCLFALDVYVSMPNTLNEVGEVVATCPNLRHLSMHTSTYAMDKAATKVLRTALESPMTLNSLGILGFYDTMKAVPTHEMDQLKHANEDWSSLTLLSFSGLSFIPSLALQMVNLRSLQVDLGTTNDSVTMRDPILNQFLYECRPLCELKLISYTETFDFGVLRHHGRALTAFTLREDHRNLLVDSGRETDRWNSGPTVVLSDKDIQTIGQSCPHLSTLGLDLRQQEDGDERSWPYSTLDAIVEHLWFVKHLDLYLEVGQTEAYRLAVTFVSVQHVWEYMWDQLRSLQVRRSGDSTQPELRSINVHNEYTQPNFVFVLRLNGPVKPLSSYSETFRARLSERDEEARRGIVTVTNDKVERLEWLLRQEEGSRLLEEKSKEARWRASVGAYEYVRAWYDDDLPYKTIRPNAALN